MSLHDGCTWVLGQPPAYESAPVLTYHEQRAATDAAVIYVTVLGFPAARVHGGFHVHDPDDYLDDKEISLNVFKRTGLDTIWHPLRLDDHEEVVQQVAGDGKEGDGGDGGPDEGNKEVVQQVAGEGKEGDGGDAGADGGVKEVVQQVVKKGGGSGGKKRGPYRKKPRICPECLQVFKTKYDKYNHYRRDRCPALGRGARAVRGVSHGFAGVNL